MSNKKNPIDTNNAVDVQNIVYALEAWMWENEI